MTRINLVKPEELHGSHLVSEYRELPRVFRLVRRAQARGLTPQTIRAPSAYTMGPGHVVFFYAKLDFLIWRQMSLVVEMRRRNYKVTYDEVVHLVAGIDRHWHGKWVPDEAAIAVSRARLQERLVQMGVTRE